MLLIQLAQGLNQTANIIKGFAIAIGVAVAVGFVWMWWLHRQRERAQEMGVRARAVWGDWLRLAVAHPELADPGLGAVSGPAEMVRYKAFVASLLAAADQVLLLEPTPEWRKTVARQLALHASLLASGDFRSSLLGDCSTEVRKLVETVTAGRPAV